MKLLGNLIWLLLFGLWAAVIHFVVGVVLCVTLVFIPFGRQHFKIARYVIWPFGRNVEIDFDRHPIMNLIWAVTGGALVSFLLIVIGVVLCVTLVGIPFAKKFFKLAHLSFIPFGAEVA